MPKADMARVNRMHEIQGELQRRLQEVADRLGKIAEAAIDLPQDRWDRLFTVLDSARDLAQKAGEVLEKEYDDAIKRAGKP